VLATHCTLPLPANHGTKILYTLDEGLLAAAKLLNVPASRGIKS